MSRSSRQMLQARPKRIFRHMVVETLEERRLLVGDWTNAAAAYDVNADGTVDRHDSSLVLQELTQRDFSNRADAQLPQHRASGEPFLDVSEDGHVSALDALFVVNSLNAGRQGVTSPCSMESLPRITTEQAPAHGGAISQISGDPINPLSLADLQDTAWGTVFVHSGESFYRNSVLSIPGRGIDWKFELTYRSGIDSEGPVGHNWRHNYQRHLCEVNPANLSDVQLSFPAAGIGDVVRNDAYGRVDLYPQSMGGFASPAGYFTRLVQNGDGTFTELDQHGNRVDYSAPDAQGAARMQSLSDRNGNQMTFSYGVTGQLESVDDTFGRQIVYLYGADDRLEQIQDFDGRTITLGYDVNGDLERVTTPAVLNTPHGNDFPSGKTERYVYSAGFMEPELNHNLLSVQAPNEVATGGSPRLQFTYGELPFTAEFDRVVDVTLGGTNATNVPSGGTIAYAYPTPDQTDVTDRNGNLTSHEFDAGERLIARRENTNRDVRPSDPAFYETLYTWNADSLLTSITRPESNQIIYTYDSNNPDRRQQGNLLSVELLPDSRSGDQTSILTTYDYEPIFNQVLATVEPRGNDPGYVPQNGGPQSAQRYTTTQTVDYQQGTNYAGLADLLQLEVPGSIPAPDNLINWLPLDEPVGVVAFDYAGSNNGMQVGNPTPVAGKVAGALSLDGIDDYVEVAPDAALDIGTSDFTVGLWLKTATAGLDVIVDHRTESPGSIQGYSLATQNSGDLVFQLGSGGAFSNYVANAGIADDQWRLVHITVDRDDPAGGQFYVDGMPIRTFDPTPHQGPLSTTRPLRLGRRSDNVFPDPGFFEGEVDEFELYDRALDAGEIQELFNAQGAGKQKGAAEVEVRLTAAGVPMGLGDVNGDGRTDQIAGNVVRIEYPTVTLLAGSNQAGLEGDTQQEIVELFGQNDFGQLVQHTDPESNVTEYAYYSEQDPDGDGTINNPMGDATTGGYLRQITQDTTSNPIRNSGTNPTPTNIRMIYEYDNVGNVTREIDGRGIATDYFVTELNQVVQITRAAEHGLLVADPPEPEPLVDFQYVERIFLDHNDNVVRRQVEDRGNTSDVGVPGDVNGDSQVDAQDIDALYDAVNSGASPTPETDLNNDGMVDQQDVDVLVMDILGTRYGDANLDSVVDGGDFNLWNASKFTVGGGWASGNFNGDGFVDGVDFGQWNANKFTQGPGPQFFAMVDYEHDYDILNRLVETRAEVSDGQFLVTKYRFDPNGNPVLTIQPEGNAMSAIMDERDLTFQTTRGALAPPALALLGPGDNTDYDVRGGLLCQCTTYHYNGNGNVIETVDAADTDLSPDNNSDLGGPGDRTRYVYNGYDQLTSVIDSVGNQTVFQYDPAGNRVREMQFGPVGGPSPTSDGPDVLPGPVSINGTVQSGNLVNSNLLAASESLFDEHSRRFQTDQVLFVNTISTVVTPDVADGATDLGKGDLTPGDNQAIPGVAGITIEGRVSTRHEYDRKSRRTFVVQDDTDTSRSFHDGSDRIIKTLDPEGNTVEFAFDDNDNLIEMQETDVSQVAGVADEVFVTTYFVDSLNRVQREVNNLGQTTDYRYDSRGNVVAMADSQGPVSGNSISRRAFAGGTTTVNTINEFGNVTRFDFDGVGRMVRQEIVLTASGTGDGASIGASIEGIKDNPSAPESFIPTPDTTQGGGDGLIRIGRTYDDNSLVSSRIDDQGNVTLYLYDNLNRRVTETKGLTTASGPLTKSLILGPREIVTPTVATTNNPAVIATQKINDQLSDAEARLTAVAGLFPPLADEIDDNPPTTIVSGYNEEDNLLILEDENDNELFTKFDAIDRATALRIFRAQQSDSHVGDPIFAPNPVNDPSNPSASFPAIVGTNKQDFQFDGLSRMVTAADNNDPLNDQDDSTVTIAYDSLSRVVEENQRVRALPTKVIATGWRAEDLRFGLVFPNDRTLRFGYDDNDRLDTIRELQTNQTIVDYNYIGRDRVLERVYPINGTRMTYLDNAGTTDVGYDGLRRPVQLRHLRNDNSLIVGFGHAYDRMNNKLTETKLHDPTNDEQYTYDARYRLTNFDRSAGGAITPEHSDFTLDGAGNWTQVDGETRDHSSFNEIALRDDGAVTTLSHDDNGNLTDDGTHEHQWDALNRLRQVVRKSDGMLIASYAYDATGRRASKSVSNSGSLDGATYFYYDGQRVIEERDGTDVLQQQYVYGNYIDEVLLLSRNLNGDNSAIGAADQQLFYHQNTQYSTYALTDDTATILEGYFYEAFGGATVYQPGNNGQVDFGGDDVVTVDGFSVVENPYLFTGRRLDAETGLYYYRSRYMDTDLGRFISRDKIGIWGDVVNNGNAYSYVGNNPISRWDALGTVAGPPAGSCCEVAGCVGDNNPNGEGRSVQMENGGWSCSCEPAPAAKAFLGGGSYSDLWWPSAASPNFVEMTLSAWKDPEYRASLSEAQLALIPDHPAGDVEFGDDGNGEESYSKPTKSPGCIKPTKSLCATLRKSCGRATAIAPEELSGVLRFWKDPEYRASLSDEQRALIPDHPAGVVDIDDDEIEFTKVTKGSGCIKPTKSLCATLRPRCSRV